MVTEKNILVFPNHRSQEAILFHKLSNYLFKQNCSEKIVQIVLRQSTMNVTICNLPSRT